MQFEKFEQSPFSLDSEAIDWVKAAFSALSNDDKLRQLFNLRCPGDNAKLMAQAMAFRPGGITRMLSGDAQAERAFIAKFNKIVPTPLLVSADLEGSRMGLPDGAEWPNPLSLAAIDDLDITKEVSRRMAQEAAASGINWSFTPVLDINHAFRSAIVATRGFGSDVDTIEKHAIAQMEVFQEHGIGATVKHWPGEGYDDRDQHLVTTINPLSMDDWKQSFGRLYQAAIDRGAMSVMSAHIALPAYANQGDNSPEAYRPASISKLLTTQLLRVEMGFNGLVVSDATSMAGLGSWSHRKDYLPELISSGCDVILFSDNPEQDLGYLRAALEDGRLTWDRINDAVARQLAMKAALGLHQKAAPLARVDRQANISYAADVALMAPTLVKDVQDNLPLSPKKHRRVLVFSGGIVFPFVPDPLPFVLPDLLVGAGFQVTIYTPGMEVSPSQYDLVLYLFGDETLLTRGRIFLDWLSLTGDFGVAMQRFWHEIPTVMISFGYPYMLYDAPRVPTYINAYSTTETTQHAVFQLLLGKKDWNENNPVDPFVGLGDAKF
ncbi:glycoside hydrolase family 3 protein [Loktanella sp. S4079]|uniref:glycoside hydrolase family 3 protein n=1 Tax=Loktanella sp. S4079 TaxID=579483 RepID=UPI0005FA2D1F|nr:glycoside hydrolase family 3 N-terminal domain-containing protein [Loktanella sp. S4079]KJZ18307.1 glycoside hydrolase family 3 [Loktanella sp. S4079]